jgi:hypothetical protein
MHPRCTFMHATMHEEVEQRGESKVVSRPRGWLADPPPLWPVGPPLWCGFTWGILGWVYAEVCPFDVGSPCMWAHGSM